MTDIPDKATLKAAIEAFSRDSGYPLKAELAVGSNLERGMIAALQAAAPFMQIAANDTMLQRGHTDGFVSGIEAAANRVEQWIKTGKHEPIVSILRALKQPEQA